MSRLGMVAGTALVIALSAAGEARAQGVIIACVGAKGTVRIVGAATACMKGETAISWNQAGPPGPPGAPGPKGDPGPPGPGLSSLESLQGLPCGTGAEAGTITLSVNPASHAASIACTPAGQFQLTLAVKGKGTITSTPAGILCGNGKDDCTHSFASGEVVSLAQTADAVSFSGWSSPCGDEATCQVTMSQARQVVATFDPILTVKLQTTPTERRSSCAFSICFFFDVFTDSKGRVTVTDADTDEPLGVCNADTTVSISVAQFGPPSFYQTVCEVPVPLGHHVALRADDHTLLGGNQTFFFWGPTLCEGSNANECSPADGIDVNQTAFAGFNFPL